MLAPLVAALGILIALLALNAGRTSPPLPVVPDPGDLEIRPDLDLEIRPLPPFSKRSGRVAEAAGPRNAPARGSSLRGDLSWLDGASRLLLLRLSPDPLEISEFALDSNGDFRTGPLRPGRYEVRVLTRNRRLLAKASLELRPGAQVLPETLFD